MSNTDMGSSDPEKTSQRAAKPRPGKTTPVKRTAPDKPTLAPQWRAGGTSRVPEDLVRSVPLVAIIGIVALAKWAPGDVQALVAVVAPILYLPGRGSKGGV